MSGRRWLRPGARALIVSVLALGGGTGFVPSGNAFAPSHSSHEHGGTDLAPQRVIPLNIQDLTPPRRAIVYRTATPLAVDGRLDEPAWLNVVWSDPFVDIEGQHRPAPRHLTRMKMLWDDEFFYVAAEMDEPDLWGTLTERDSVIFRDHDFEVFIDPDGDTHNYYELEVNVLGTEWDLMLGKPYRDGGPARNEWDIPGLRVGIEARGTINRPGDRDEGWTIEIAMPWSALREFAPGQRAPGAGEQWRVNFSRVEWQLDVVNGGYVKRVDRTTGEPLAEDNWVWSPQGAINMHMPERWGYAQFSNVVAGVRTDDFVEDPNERVKWALRQLYYRQREYFAEHGRYAEDLVLLRASDVAVARGAGRDLQLSLQGMGNRYEIRANGASGSLVFIRQDGLTWVR